jgi:hypothetical protein
MVSFMPQLLYSREDAPSSLWVGVWVDCITGLDAVVKRKNSFPVLLGIEHPVMKSTTQSLY